MFATRLGLVTRAVGRQHRSLGTAARRSSIAARPRLAAGTAGTAPPRAPPSAFAAAAAVASTIAATVAACDGCCSDGVPLPSVPKSARSAYALADALHDNMDNSRQVR